MNGIDKTQQSKPSLKNPVFVKFLIVNAVFIFGMAIILVMKWHNVWLWIAYISIWWWAEVKASQGLELGWKGWAIFFVIITLIDLLVISLTT